MQIVQARTARQIDEARQLFRAFVAWAQVQLVEDLELVNRYFAPHLFEPELAGLPGDYASPGGSLLLAYDDGMPLGCVAMRPLEGGACEMKRLYVTPQARGRGVARALVARLIEDARAAGYGVMRLDTSMHQHEAMALYEQIGFRAIGPYREVPDELRNWLRYYELKL